jgi:protein ImuA
MSALPAASVATLASLPPGLVWTAGRLARPARKGWATGFPALDAALPGDGWPHGAIIELISAHPGIGEIHLLLPLLRRAPADKWIAWVAPPCLPYAPALASLDMPLSQLLLIDVPDHAGAIWAARQALASGACHAVLAWNRHIDAPALRRLQLAAEESDTPLFLFRPPAAARQPSPATLRLQLMAAHDGLDIVILKRRGPAAAHPIRISVNRRLNDLSSHALDSPDPARLAPAGIHTQCG